MKAFSFLKLLLIVCAACCIFIGCENHNEPELPTVSTTSVAIETTETHTGQETVIITETTVTPVETLVQTETDSFAIEEIVDVSAPTTQVSDGSQSPEASTNSSISTGEGNYPDQEKPPEVDEESNDGYSGEIFD